MKKSSRKSRVAIPRKDAKVLRQFVQAAELRDGKPATGPKPAVLLGQKIGARLVASTPTVMFREFSDHLTADSPAGQRWIKAWDSLTSALGVMQADPDVAAALHAIDDAHGAALLEIEDVTWHAAFRLATGLKGGAR